MKKRALVVVLGELSKSPRMQYHCVSLANNNYQVTVMGYSSGDSSCEELESNINIKQEFIPIVPNLKPFIGTLLYYLIKPIWLTISLLYCLSLTLFSFPHVILVQNPPSIPTLPVLVLYSKIVRNKLIIDWHNYGYSILALNLKPDNHLISLSKRIEFFFGRYADAAFCVTESMRKDLIENHDIRCPIKVLYDKPPARFKRLSPRKKHNFFLKMQHSIPEFRSAFDDETLSVRSTRFTINMTNVANDSLVVYGTNRPAIIMSSTSWTDDEDFGILLEALKSYDSTKTLRLLGDDFISNNESCRLPDILCVVTGKGPLKAYYENLIKEYKFQHVEIILPWFTAKDYPKMVASADLGVSLHLSSSGVDLPMKVVDMFGCGVPVLAYRYEAIGELVKEDFYGLTFKSSNELCEKLVFLLKDFYDNDNGPSNLGDGCSIPLARYRKNISRHFLVSHWEDNWNREAKPLIDKLCHASIDKSA